MSIENHLVHQQTYRGTYQLIKHVFLHECVTEEERRLRFCINKLIAEHDVLFGKYGIRSYELDATTYQGFITDVGYTMFEDNLVHWGRIISFLAFCEQIHKRLGCNYLPGVLRIAVDVLLNICGSWIMSVGGWSGILKFNPEGEHVSEKFPLTIRIGTILTMSFFIYRLIRLCT